MAQEERATVAVAATAQGGKGWEEAVGAVVEEMAAVALVEVMVVATAAAKVAAAKVAAAMVEATEVEREEAREEATAESRAEAAAAGSQTGWGRACRCPHG